MNQNLNSGESIDPKDWIVRCKQCGFIFTMALILKKYPAQQKDVPPGMWFCKCPKCGKEDFLTQPDLFVAMQKQELERKMKREPRRKRH